MFDKLFKTNTGIILLSIIWGLGLSTLFKYSCNGKDCKIIEYIGPNPDKIENSTFKYGTNDCYRFKPLISDCN